jgi:hypothetical protein
MQNSELFRRGFVVPLNQEAEKDLRDGNVYDNTTVEFVELSDDVFYSLWHIDFFKHVSEKTSTNMDDYEEDVVENRFIGKLQEVILDFKAKFKNDSQESIILNELYKITVTATNNAAAVFFIL